MKLSSLQKNCYLTNKNVLKQGCLSWVCEKLILFRHRHLKPSTGDNRF